MPPWQHPRVIIHSQPPHVTDASCRQSTTIPLENTWFALSCGPGRYSKRSGQTGKTMAKLEDIVKRQKQGAKFVLSAQMLSMDVETFDTVAQTWIEHGGPGFESAGVPFRKVIDGEFLIARLTVVKTDPD